MQARITFSVSKIIEVPEGTLTSDMREILKGLTSVELLDGAKIEGVYEDDRRQFIVRLPHAGTVIDGDFMLADEL
jgi:hypothetical protein